LKIYYDKEKTKALQDLLEEKWEDIARYGDPHKRYRVREKRNVRGRERHVSDVLYCSLKYICRLLGIPKKKESQTAIGNMLFGIVAQKLIQWIYPPEYSEYEALIYDIVIGHVDVFEELKYPIEIKASRKKVLKREDLPQKWLEQLVTYMSILSAPKGWIAILNIFTSTLMVWCVELTDTEMLTQLIDICNTVQLIQEAEETKNYDKIPIHPSEYKWCRYKKGCPRREECKRRQRKKKGKKSPLD
jgi:hypothetical protein